MLSSGADLSDASLLGAVWRKYVRFTESPRPARHQPAWRCPARPRGEFIVADLRNASLIGADLRGAVLSGAYLFHADLNGTHLFRADLTDAKGLTQAQLDAACGEDAQLPPGLTLQPCLSEQWRPVVAPTLNPGTTP